MRPRATLMIGLASMMSGFGALAYAILHPGAAPAGVVGVLVVTGALAAGLAIKKTRTASERSSSPAAREDDELGRALLALEQQLAQAPEDIQRAVGLAQLIESAARLRAQERQLRALLQGQDRSALSAALARASISDDERAALEGHLRTLDDAQAALDEDIARDAEPRPRAAARPKQHAD